MFNNQQGISKYDGTGIRPGLDIGYSGFVMDKFVPRPSLRHSPPSRARRRPGEGGTSHLQPPALCVALLLCLQPFALLADSHTWDGGGANSNASLAANWVGDTAPIANDDVVLNTTSHKNMTWDLNISLSGWSQIGYTGKVSVATVYGTSGFTNFNITGDCTISNGVWTQIANPNVNYESNRLSATIGGNLTLGSNASIDVKGKGYANSQGPGSGASGGYGGRAKIPWNITQAGWCYGSITAPTNLGSGGGSAGGGAILLRVSGTLRNEGLICADGAAAAYYTGSGGSVYLVAGAITGGGVIRAYGGASGATDGAGGGRIALVVTNAGADFSFYTGTVLALAGGSLASAGTVYREKSGDSPGKGELIVNNSGGGTGYAAANTDINSLESTTYEFSRITLTNNGILNIGSDDTLILTNAVLVGAGTTGNGIWISGGTFLTHASAFVYSNLFIGITATGSVFSPASNLFVIGTNAEFRLDVPYRMNEVIVEAGGKLTHTANATSETYKIDLAIPGNLTVRTGGSVNVTGSGYRNASGPGGGQDGSYGGRGDTSQSVQQGPCYGSVTAPTNLGSGGSTYGGGAILMNVAGVISNHGLICADSVASTYYTGSGGSIYLIAGGLTGDGTIRASCGNTSGGYTGGGGGRIALVVTNAGADFSSFTGPIQAFGSARGGAGTVYLRTAAQKFDEGILIINNNNLSLGNATIINSNVTDAVVGDVLIRNNAHLLIDTNQALTLGGVWSNAARFEAYWGAKVIFAGNASSTSTVYGSNTFMELVCTNGAGKTILFEAGRTNFVAAQGRLTLIGSAAATNLFLRSTGDGAPWKLKVDPLAEQSVSYVDVKDSDAMLGVGAEVTAMNSRNSGANFNWRFITVTVAETNVWTGNSNTVWSVRQNWSLDRSPIGADFIRIPSGRPRYPVLDAIRTVNGIEIQAGARLDLAGYDLTVTTNAVVAGAIKALGSETITFKEDVDFAGGSVTAAYATIVFEGDVDFAGGSFTPGNSTVKIAGNAPQSVDPANLAFYKVNLLNSAGTIFFGAGFSATELRCEAPVGTRNITFQQGSLITLRDLVLLGPAAGTNIFLRSSSLGQKWRLAVSGYESVRGVDVQDSDASPGQTITATSSKNSGGNVNWLFDATWSVWLGSSGVNFHDPANWSPAGVPGASSRVLVESANPMTITGAVTILDLTVGGGAGAASVTGNAPLTVVEDITILTNGTITLNRPCVVSNGVYVLSGGTLTHSVNAATEINKLIVTAYGNVEVDQNGQVSANGKGYANGQGPGGGSEGSHGGRGDISSATPTGPCYGSVVAPTNLGSGGGQGPGGGAILLTVLGMVRNDGVICADGAPSTYYTGAGGSVNIVAGTLTGVGIVRANGGIVSTGQIGGGGGRIALVVTSAGADFSLYTGAVLALGGGPKTGAGTIYRQRASDFAGRGTVLVDNNTIGFTGVPPSLPNVTNEVNFAPFHITNAAALWLTNNYTIGDIFLLSSNSQVNLGSNTLTVRSRAHPLGLGVVSNYGAIIWWPDIPKGTVYSIW